MADLFLVFRADLADESFIDEVNEMIEGMGVILRSVFLYDHSERRNDDFVEHFWLEQKKDGAGIVLVDDHKMPGRYLYVSGGDEKQVMRIWKNLKVMLPVLEVDELRREAGNAAVDPGALQRLAFGLNDAYDEESFQLFVRALESDRRDVRMSSAAAMVILKWRQFLGPLRRALAHESTDEGRRSLAWAISMVEQRGVTVAEANAETTSKKGEPN